MVFAYGNPDITLEVKVFKILFVWLFLFCFSAFGEKAPETSKVVSTKEVNKAVSKGTVPAKAEVKASASSTELDQSSNISPSPASQEDSSVKSGESSTGSLTYHEALESLQRGSSSGMGWRDRDGF